MQKIFVLATLVISFITGIANAYYGQSENSPMSKYLRGEISSQECTDHYAPRIYNQEATIYNSDGSKSLIKYSRY